MPLATNIGLLATRIGNYLRDSVLPRLLPSGGAAGQVLAKISGTAYAVQWVSPLGLTKVETFSANGTWTKEAGAKTVEVYLQGAGGGGASGGTAGFMAVARGGSPGGNGGFVRAIFNADDLPASVALTIGVGGTGGASVTANSTAGNSGANGTATTWSASTPARLSATGGTSGGPGTSGTPGSGSEGPATSATSSNTNGGAGPTTNILNWTRATSGGAGAGQPTSQGSFNGGTTVNTSGVNLTTLVGATLSVGSTKTNATPATIPFPTSYGVSGAGGNGGWCNADGTAGPGADGHLGGGGGGGGGSINGNPSGAGGAGGNGRAVIITRFN